MENENKDREFFDADHRLIGEQLDLFSINEEVGAGLALWHPNGTTVRNIMRDYWEKQHLRNGYKLVCTPHVARAELWKTSGHLDFYEQNMYLFEKDGEGFVVKPMNCPFHIQIYKAKPRSYRELPLRYTEWGTVYRYERSGTLQGLLRVRGFTQDDAHIFCTAEQVDDEVLRILNLAEVVLSKFGFNEYRWQLSTRDPKQPRQYMGSEEQWKAAQESLAETLKKKGIEYQEAPGEAVFYGPKIDLSIRDSSGKQWQCTTVQFDFNLPKRFNITYTGADGKDHLVIMIHRVLLGAIERFFAILLEHCHGNLPAWLAPIQAIVLPISRDNLEYAQEVNAQLLADSVRTELDATESTISYRIRQAELRKVPYMAICGKRESDSEKIVVRKHTAGNIGSLSVDELVAMIKNEGSD